MDEWIVYLALFGSMVMCGGMLYITYLNWREQRRRALQ